MRKALLGFTPFQVVIKQVNSMDLPKIYLVFKNSSNEIIDAFGHLGVKNLTPDVDSPSLESFVMSLYCKQKIPNVSSLSNIRRFLFSKKESESHQTPPTYSTLKEKSNKHILLHPNRSLLMFPIILCLKNTVGNGMTIISYTMQ